ncbi:hypothetical protein RvVAT039_pl08520 (plasmid) [Agrobacterium vitis]|nr:hypothetical protein RvVAR0630_pl06820 [Agrobacterium vitis]BCH68019.1 hypothetical protein RvVAT039_pl08520 [Agrobacterium vitis]
MMAAEARLPICRMTNTIELILASDRSALNDGIIDCVAVRDSLSQPENTMVDNHSIQGRSATIIMAAISSAANSRVMSAIVDRLRRSYRSDSHPAIGLVTSSVKLETAKNTATDVVP